MIYVIGMGKTKYAKIGYTRNDDVYKRLAELQTSCPEKLFVHCTIPHGDTSTESKLHQFFSGLRSSGGREWFTLTDEDLRWLATDDIESLIRKLDEELSRRAEQRPTDYMAKNETIQVRFTSAEKARIERLAGDYGLELAEFVRTVMEYVGEARPVLTRRIAPTRRVAVTKEPV